MKENIDQNKTGVRKEFEELLSKDLDSRKFSEGEITKAVISEIGKKYIFVDLGLKSEGAIPVEEFKFSKEIDQLKVGSQIEIMLERIENFRGDVVVSREKARRHQSWKRMEKAFENKEEVSGSIISKVKGGFIVDVDSCLCFLPGSQIDLKPLKNIDHLMKVPQTFECVKIDKKRMNIVLSRRAILSKRKDKDKSELLSKLNEGDIVEGTVKHLTEWGAFVDLNGVDSLLHITDISWVRVNKPSELLSVGQTIKVKITKIDPETKKISVGIKQLTEDPFEKYEHKYEVGKIYEGVVSKVQEYGCFVKLNDGVEGLVYQTELSWTKKNPQPGKILSTSQKIKVKILEKDTAKRRLALSYKATQMNPWEKLIKENPVGSEVEGAIKNITDFALFVTINNSELDGMIHYKDLNWSEEESELQKYKKKQNIKAKILEINEEKEKIRLGIKQLENDPFDFFKDKKQADVITVVVQEVLSNGIKVSIGKEKINIIIKKNQLSKESARFNRGDKIDAMISELDTNKRKVSLSIKALEEKLTKEALKKYGSKDSGASLRDILGPVLKKKKKKD
jgi:small subunit ribosomal protein S1